DVGMLKLHAAELLLLGFARCQFDLGGVAIHPDHPSILAGEARKLERHIAAATANVQACHPRPEANALKQALRGWPQDTPDNAQPSAPSHAPPNHVVLTLQGVPSFQATRGLHEPQI